MLGRVQNPSKYHLAYMLYRERTVAQDLKDLFKEREDDARRLEGTIKKCKENVTKSMRELLASKCRDMKRDFSEELNNSWTFCATYPTLLAGITFAGKGEDPDEYEGDAGTSLLSRVLRSTRELFSLPEALEMQDSDIALDTLVAGCTRFKEVDLILNHKP